ncbi:MAG: hypothetical protein V4509_00525 [Patescibacteria group bacterium]
MRKNSLQKLPKIERELVKLLVQMIVAERTSRETASATVMEYLPKIKHAVGKILTDAQK